MPEVKKRYDFSYTQNRELSWLSFNRRVMEEAADARVPLIERLRFLSIFTSNLDEFFMVRVGSLLDLELMTPEEAENKSGKTPRQQLNMIYDAVRPLIRMRDAIYFRLMEELKQKGIEDIPYANLSGSNREYAHQYYRDHIRPLLSPQIIDHNHPFPHLKNKAIYAVARLRRKNRTLLGIVPMPESVPPILMLPDQQDAYVRTETILAYYLKKIFHIYVVEEQTIISVTRNADISYDDEKFDDDNPDFRSHMTKLLRIRERLSPVRLEAQGEAPELIHALQERLKLTEQQTYICRCPLVFGYAYDLDLPDKTLYEVPYTPVYPAYLRKDVPMYQQIRQRDVLLFYPYHSMEPFLNLLEQSAKDPKVVSIQITIYRLARNSAIVQHLCEAAHQGKQVTAVVELRARFDEQNNITWAKTLEEAGCRVVYGLDGFKCHSKLCLITRQERSGISYITQIGTGNYNEKTAKQYTDLSMMTANADIARDAVSFFQNLLIGNLWGQYETLLVAPVSMRDGITERIQEEIQKGSEGRIIIKVNSVTERSLIDQLEAASQAGVQIDLIVRGICCLLPGVPGKTDHIRVTSVVGRFLEHSRVYCFGTGEESKIYISSADMMTRNQMRRLEVACPVLSGELKGFLQDYLSLLLHDNTKARRLQPDGSYLPVEPEGEPVCAQEYFLNHSISLAGTIAPRQNPVKKLLDRALGWATSGRG